MQNFESQSEEKKEDKYEVWRQEIVDIGTAEMAKKEKGEKYDPHFDVLNPQELTEADLDIFRAFKEKALKKEDYALYQEETRRETQQGIFTESRSNFSAWLVNKINADLELMAQWDPKHKDLYEKLAQKKKEKGEVA